jgi:hypothetical protein
LILWLKCQVKWLNEGSALFFPFRVLLITFSLLTIFSICAYGDKLNGEDFQSSFARLSAIDEEILRQVKLSRAAYIVVEVITTEMC